MKIRFGILGLGTIAAKFADAANRNDRVILYGAASRNIRKASEFAARFQAEHAYGSYQELIDDPAVDAVYIALPHSLHREWSEKALLAGKAVLCEKPLSITRSEMDSMIELAQRKGLLLMEGMWTRCLPAYRKAEKWIQEGRIGEIRLIDSAFCYHEPFDPTVPLYNPNLAGGALYDVGIYSISFSIGILQEFPSKVEGFAKIGPSGVDESDGILLSFPSGAVSTMRCAIAAEGISDAYLFGTKGYIRMPNFYGADTCELYAEDHTLLEQFREPFENGFCFELDHFIDLWKSGRIESDRIPFDHNRVCGEIFDFLMEKWNLRSSYPL